MSETMTTPTPATETPVRPTPEQPTAEQLAEILRLHGDWIYGRAGGRRADLSGADLSDAVLRRADLRRAVLRDADLRRADLSGADLSDAVLRRAVLSGAVLRGAVLSDAVLRGAVLSDDTVLTDGVVWREYLNDVVPSLLVAGGRPLTEVATPEVWACHTWSNCPMHAAFGAEGLHQVPALYRAHANLFVQLYDAGLIPLAAITAAPAVAPTEV